MKLMVSQVWDPQLNVFFVLFIYKGQNCVVRIDPLPILIYSTKLSHLRSINYIYRVFFKPIVCVVGGSVYRSLQGTIPFMKD